MIEPEDCIVEPIKDCPHVNHFRYAPQQLPFTIEACTRCGYTTVSAQGTILYETYLSTPILVGFGGQLFSLIREFFAAKR
jgi:hypothetical protein